MAAAGVTAIGDEQDQLYRLLDAALVRQSKL
jgi:hypothetical protein